MGNLQLYGNNSSMFDNPWIDMAPMPRDCFVDDIMHPIHRPACVYTLNDNVLLLIADCNVILFNASNSVYEKMTKIPQYVFNKQPPTIKAINVSTYYKDGKFHFIIFQSNLSLTTMYELVIDIYDEHDVKCKIKYEWNDIKSLYMKNDKLIDLKCSNLLFCNDFLFLFYIQIWPTRMLAVFNLNKNHQMIIHKIDDNKWFSISSMISINNYKFLSFNNIGPEILTYYPLQTQKRKRQIIQEQIEFPVGFNLYFSTKNIKFSNYIIRFGSYSDCSSTGSISIYDYINNKWYKSNIKGNANELIHSCTIQNRNGSRYIHCFGRDKSNNSDLKFTASLLNHYKLNIELLLFDLELFIYWDDSEHSRILYVIHNWLRMRGIHSKEWNDNLSKKIMTYLCDKII